MAYITIEENNEERLEKLKRILEENGFEVVETEKSEDSENIPIAGLAKDGKHRTSELLYGYPPPAHQPESSADT